MLKYLAAVLIVSSACCCAAQANTYKRCEALWGIENQKIRVVVDESQGSISVLDKTAKVTWKQPLNTMHMFNNIHITSGVDEITFDTVLGYTGSRPNNVTVTMSVPADSNQLVIEADMGDRSTRCDGFDFLEPFVLDTPKSCIAIADYCDGHLYPADIASFPFWDLGSYNVNLLDMPWVGLCDLDSGLGYSVIIDTSDDATLKCIKYGSRRAPLVHWEPQLGRFGYKRKLIYNFASSGGYVALAKAYRSYLQANGGLVTMEQKAQANPNIRKLYGAPLVWDYSDYIDGKEMKAAGVDKAVHHVWNWTDPGNKYSSSSAIAAGVIANDNNLGYLTEEYDQYYDAYPYSGSNNTPSSLYDQYPDHMAMDSNLTVRNGWYGAFGQMYRRCPSFYQAAAQNVIPPRLQSLPMNSRYMDVHTALEIQECYDPDHMKSRTQWKQDNLNILNYVRGLKLVLGGEHGKWWAIPYVDMFDGVMSSVGWPWNSAHPTTYGQTDYGTNGKVADDAWQKYESWGSVSYANRAPLWELVFHDCAVAHWYPDDSTDWTVSMTGGGEWYQARKDAINVLYGTPATFFNCGSDGSWYLQRQAFLDSYRDTCKPHEVLADKEMVSHFFLTGDHSVQKTTWSDGTVSVVNFGSGDYSVMIDGVTYVLPTNGFVVKGPKIEESRVRSNGSIVTTINMSGYHFTDASGVGVTMRGVNTRQLRVNTDKALTAVTIRPADVASAFNTSSMRILQLDTSGNRVGNISFTKVGSDQISIGPFSGPMYLDVISY